MARLGPPIRVPAGFIATTQACIAYLDRGGAAPPGSRKRSTRPWRHSRERGKRLGDPTDHFSYRCGPAPRIDAGNDGYGAQPRLCDETAAASRRVLEPSASPGFLSGYIQMFGDVVCGIDHDLFERAIRDLKSEPGVTLDTELGSEDLRGLVASSSGSSPSRPAKCFPRSRELQLSGRWPPSSTLGTVTGRSNTAGSTASPTIGGPR